MNPIQDSVVVITGASRGIGRELALMCARNKAKAVVLASKTVDPHPTLKGTILTVAQEVEALGSEAMPFRLDVRDEARAQEMMNAIKTRYGRIDILVNNASAISPTGTEQTTMKKYDLLQSVNVRGTFMISKLAIPLLRQSRGIPHVLTMSPPIDLESSWIGDSLAYAISKYGMSMVTIGMAKEFQQEGIKFNSLWPRKVVATAAVAVNFPPEVFKVAVRPNIMSDAAFEIFTNRDFKNKTGQVYIDYDVLGQTGHDLKQYEYGEKGAMAEDFLRVGDKPHPSDGIKPNWEMNRDLDKFKSWQSRGSRFRKNKAKL